MAIIGTLTLDQINILEVDADPTSSGVSSPIGSMALLYDNANARVWVKTGAGDTAWTPQPKIVPGTALGNSTLVLTDASGQLTTNTTQFVWDSVNGRLGIGSAAPPTPVNTIHLDRGTAQGSDIKFTAGTTTGQTSGDGFSIGIDAAGVAYVNQFENAQLILQTNNTRQLTLTPAGQVLVGQSTAAIDVTGLSAFPIFQFIGTSAVQMAGIQYSADTIGPVFNILKSRGATIGTHGLVSSSDEFGRIQFRASDGVNFQAGASIRALVDGTAAAGSMPGRLILMTTPLGAVTPVERMRISQDGLVKVVDNLQRFRAVEDFSTTATANTTTTLTVASAGIIVYTGTTAGQIVRLPDATTLVVGQVYYLYNQATVNYAIQNNAGTALETCFSGTGSVVARLLTNGTAAGTWLTRSRFEPFASEASSAAGMSINSTTDVLITTMTITPAAGTYRVTFDCAATATTNNSTLGFAVYAGGTINTNSNKTFQVDPANTIYFFGTSGTVTVDGTQAIEIRGRRSAGTTTVNNRNMYIERIG